MTDDTKLTSIAGFYQLIDALADTMTGEDLTLTVLCAAQEHEKEGKLNAAQAIALEMTKAFDALIAEKLALKAKLAAQSPWIKITSMDDLPKKKTNSYEQVECLVRHKGETKHLVWNCEHHVWDDAHGDDFYCDALEPSHYMPFPDSPKE